MRSTLLVLALLLTGCGTADPEPTSTSPTTSVPATTPPSTEPTATPTPTDGTPPFPDGTGRQMHRNKGGWDLVLSGVRTGTHDGYDRVVLEFEGTGTPGWVANYVDQPVQDGSGETAPLDGDAFLDVYARGTTYPLDDEGYAGPRLVPVDGGSVGDVYVVGTFEGDTQVLLGIGGEAVPFRVFALRDPARLVIDVIAP